MANLSDIGNLMSIDIDIINPPIDEKEITSDIRKLAQKIKKQKRNWSPVILRELGDDIYEIAGDRETLIATKLAGQSKVWSVIAPPDFDGDEIKLRNTSANKQKSEPKVAKLKKEKSVLKPPKNKSKKKKKCIKGYSCGASCINKSKTCRKSNTTQANQLTKWLKTQAS